ncbi:MAG: hypothetical protein QXU26_03530 [Thermofilaceae archaeon]
MVEVSRIQQYVEQFTRVRIDERLWRAVREAFSAVFGASYVASELGDFSVAFTWAIGHVVPGSEVNADALIVKDPGTGDVLVVVPWFDDVAYVNPVYGISGEDVDRLLRGVLNAVYSFALPLYLYLLERKAQLAVYVEALLRSLVELEPLLIDSIRNGVERLLRVAGYSGYSKYLVKAPEWLSGRVPPEEKFVVMKTAEDDVEVEVAVVNRYVLHVSVKEPFWFHAILLLVPRSNAEFEARVLMTRMFPDRVPEARVVEKLALDWRSIALRAVEARLMYLESQRRRRTREMELLEFWRDLLRHGEWVLLDGSSG